MKRTQVPEGKLNRTRSGGGGLRTRGVVRTRGFALTPATSAIEPSDRRRGAVRTRGGARPKPEMSPKWEMLAAEGLPSLFDRLRDQQEGFPITIVVENHRQPKSEEFLEKIDNLKTPKDALWLLGDKVEDLPDSGYLNPDVPDDESFAQSLVADLLFVAAGGDEELEERLKKWKRRARAVIVARPSNESIPINGAVGLPGLRYCWK